MIDVKAELDSLTATGMPRNIACAHVRELVERSKAVSDKNTRQQAIRDIAIGRLTGGSGLRVEK